MKFYVKTYGCQMNERDSEAVSALLLRRGHARSLGEADADVVMVNTCSVREKAEGKALGRLRMLVAGKRHHPQRRVGAVGCMVQRMGATLLKKVPGLDFAVGTRRLAAIPGILERVQAGHGPVLAVEEDGDDIEALTGHAESGPAAFVNILFGCDRRCTYCVVPFVRGREWSRPADGIIAEVRALAASGVKEVTLLGQSVTAYGRGSAGRWFDGASEHGYTEPFPRLLEALSPIPGLARIRFTSGHPAGCTGELARAMSELPPVCEHLHLPVQSGSDRILGLMRRGYTVDGYRRAVERLRRACPGIALTTDAIVGFPSETLDDFEMTRALMNEIGFDNSFIFKYSPRPDTPAAEWNDDVPAEEKMRRNGVLLVDQDETGLRINLALEGTVVEVLAEGVSMRNARRWSGRTRTNKIVIFEPAGGTAIGDLLRVKIDGAKPQTLYGSLVS